MGRLRHNLVFHYDESSKLIMKAISDRAERTEARHSSITRGSTAYLWHFKPADDIVDSIVVRQIWGIPRDKDLRAEIDIITDEVHQLFLCFVDLQASSYGSTVDDREFAVGVGAAGSEHQAWGRLKGRGRFEADNLAVCRSLRWPWGRR